MLPTRLKGRLLWSPTGLGPLVVGEQVLTVHDVSFLDHPEWYNQKFALWYGWLIPRLVRRVERVITVSNFSKQSIVRRTGISEDKVFVIPNGVDTHEFYPRSVAEIRSVIEALEIPTTEYVLSLGTLEPRKNLRRLVDAWARIHNLVPSDVWLVIAGAKGGTSVFRDADIPRLPPRVFLTGYVPDQHLPALYSGAMVLAYVSLYEGFGLPALESMATGTPSLTGDLTAIPEAVGEAGLMVDPYDVEDIAQGLLRLIQDSALREDLRSKGLDRAKQYTWEACAKSTLEVLHDSFRRIS